jgi:hypothetical protein
MIRAGQHAKIPTVDSIVEKPDMIHRGANRGTTPVVILIASLFRAGALASIPAHSTRRPLEVAQRARGTFASVTRASPMSLSERLCWMGAVRPVEWVLY